MDTIRGLAKVTAFERLLLVRNLYIMFGLSHII